MAGNETLDIYQELINRNAVPAEHRDTVDELVRRGVLRAAAPAKPELGPVIGALKNFNDNVTFGLWDKAVAAGRSVLGGGSYDQNLAEERAKTQSAGGLPWLVGQTAGNVATGLATLPKQAAVGSYEASKALMEPARNLFSTFREVAPEAARYGAAFGGLNAAGHADGGAGQQLYDTAVGMGTGAVLGPVIAGGALATGAGLARFQQRRDAARDANMARAQEARDVGITDPMPAIVSDNRLLNLGTRGSSSVLGGDPINNRIAENTSQVTGSLNRLLAKPIEGREAGDLGLNIQQDLRRALTSQSKSADEIARMSPAEREAIIGKIGEEGFRPPRPKVDPVAPRPVDEVSPRDIGPEPIPPAVSERIPWLEQRVRERARAIDAAVAEHNKIEQAVAAVRERYAPVLKKQDELTKQEQALRAQFDAMTGEGGFQTWSRQRSAQYQKMTPEQQSAFNASLPGRTPHDAFNAELKKLADQHAGVVRQMQEIAPDVAVANDAMARYGSTQDRVTNIRKLHGQRETVERHLAEAKAQDAAQRVSYEQQAADYTSRRQQAYDEAAAETVRRRQAAQEEAQAATTAAERAAQQEYEQRLAKGGQGFRIGNSRESYPTELSVAYETAWQEAPKGVKFNPLSSRTSAVNAVLEDVAKRAKGKLAIRDFNGKAFDEDGRLAEPFAGYLRSQIGPDMAARFEALAEIRNRGPVPQPGIQGMKDMLSDLRALAREVEKTPYGAQPRTEDAALLRRLATAVQRELYDTMRQAGSPASFRTAEGEYKVLPDGRTQFGDRAPTDATYFMTPESLSRMTRGEGKPGQTLSVPATRSLKAERDTVGYAENNPMRPTAGEFDRSTLVPFERRPEPGLVPVQVWADGSRVSYGQPVTSRATTTGERAVSMFQNADQEYAKFVTELRKPLHKIFGENVTPVQAMDRLVDAARKGETGILNAYSRVMSDKSDPAKGTAAIIYHMTDGGRDFRKFMATWRELKPASRDALFHNGPTRALESAINRHVAVMERLEKLSAGKTAGGYGKAALQLSVAGAMMQWPQVVATIGGNYVAAKVMSWPRLVTWLTQVPSATRGGFETAAFAQHMARLSAIGSRAPEAERVVVKALSASFDKLSGRTP